MTVPALTWMFSEMKKDVDCSGCDEVESCKKARKNHVEVQLDLLLEILPVVFSSITVLRRCYL